MATHLPGHVADAQCSSYNGGTPLGPYGPALPVVSTPLDPHPTMRIPYSWLAQYVDLSGLDAHQVAEALTRSGLEIEAVERLTFGFQQVIVADVLATETHPNADRLKLVTLQVAADGTTQQVVCGAPNVAAGMRVAFALDGATVYSRKDGEWFTLKPANIRGVESRGMVCALDELQLAELFPKDAAEPGIWVLNTKTQGVPAGTDLKAALCLKEELILDAAIPANRADLMGILGVAREVAALFSRPLTLPQAQRPAEQYPQTADPATHFALTLPDATRCTRYRGGLLTNVKVGPSPDWLRERLQWAGMRSINNVVDITNYVMLETGQPLHAFDRHQLDAQDGPFEISVRPGHEGETMTTLDEQTLTLTPSLAVVTCNDTPVALAGIKGGLTSGINDATHTVLLEAALFPSALVRRGSKQVGIRTESSARFERGTNPETLALAFSRATQLLQELAGATPVAWQEATAGGALDAPRPAIRLTLTRFQQLTGVTVPLDTAREALEKLGFTILKDDNATSNSNGVRGKAPQEKVLGGESEGPTHPDANAPQGQTRSLPAPESETLTVQPPVWREQDITQEADVVEEILRIVGYDTVPYTRPTPFQVASPSAWEQFAAALSAHCQGAGQMTEWMTNSLVGLDAHRQFYPQAQIVPLSNAKSPDHNALRTGMLPSLLDAVRHHQDTRAAAVVRAYEWARVFEGVAAPTTDKETGIRETLRLTATLWRARGEQPAMALAPWQTQGPDLFWELKGWAEALLETVVGLKPEQILWSADLPQAVAAGFHPGQSVSCFYQQHPKATPQLLGWLGVVHPAVQSTWKLKTPAVVADLDAQALFPLWQQRPTPHTTGLKPVPTHPYVERDLALLVPESVSWQALYQVLKTRIKAPLTHVSLFDQYQGEGIPDGQKSLALRLRFQKPHETLTDEEINGLVDKALKLAEKECNAMLR